MKVRKRELSSMPPWPMIRSRGRPVASSAAWHITSIGLAKTMMMALGLSLRRVLGRVVADDLGVALQQVFARHAGLARRAGGDDDDVGVRRWRPSRPSAVSFVSKPAKDAPWHDVERLAVVLGELGDVLDHDVADVLLGQPVGHDAAGLSAADDGYFLASAHVSSVSSAAHRSRAAPPLN